MEYKDTGTNISNLICSTIESSGVLRIKYEFNPQIPSMTIKSPEFSAALSTIMGGSNTDHLELNADEVDRFPHDAVLSRMYVGPVVRVEDLTPDAKFGDTYLELATRDTWVHSPLEKALTEKLTKYHHLPCEVVCVGHSEVCSTISLSMRAQLILMRTFTYAMNIKRAFKTLMGITKLSWSQMPRPETKVQVQLEKSPEVESKFSQFWASYPQGKITKVVCHLPIILKLDDMEENEPIVDAFHMRSWHRMFIQQMRIPVLEHKIPWEKIHETKANEAKGADYVKIDLEFEDKIKLACMGVNGKRYRNVAEVKTHYERSKLFVDKHSDTNIVEHAIPDVNEFSLGLLDHIVRESLLNAKRKTKEGQFIVRKLLGRPVWILQHNTRYNDQDDKPWFVSVVFKGLPSRHFINVTEIKDGWHMTDFFSLDRRRAEHLVGVDLQSKALYHMLSEQLRDQPSNVDRATAIMTMALLSDNQSFSAFSQLLRYYYMNIYSGYPDGPKRALRILQKAEPARCLMTLWLMRTLESYHHTAPKMTSLRLPPADDPEVIMAEKALDDFPTMMTPFGFVIKTADHMVLASYVCMLKNKNEQNKGHDSKVVLQKILKNEYLYRDHPVGPFASDPELFQCNPEFINHGCQLLIKHIESDSEGVSYEQLAEESLARVRQRSTISSLFSTKSSSTADGETYNSENYDKRSKVFIRMIEEEQNIQSEFVHELLHTAMDRGKPNVSLFKKNQIGGTREIYILEFWFRVIVKYLEDISRSLCNLIPEEVLTKPQNRDRFLSKHLMRVERRYGMKVTLKWSGDMTNWANLMRNEYFKQMLKNLLPPNLYSDVEKVLDFHQRKKLYCPKALLDSFTTSNNVLSDPNLMRMREEFLGLRQGLIMEKGRPYIENVTNMMQGILHYTSSLYHVVHMLVLKEHLELHGFITDFLVSSDDESVLMTIVGSEQEVKSKLAMARGIFTGSKVFVDRMFGVRTNWVKSVFSSSELREFNSIFYAANTEAIPLIKFVCRSIDDNVSESLHSRVSNMYSLLRQVRESGGSGLLCSQISKLQKENLDRNMGKGWVSWFDESLWESIPKLSFLGRYEDQSPILAGLLSTDFQNWKCCRTDPRARGLMAKYGVWGFLDYYDSETATTYNMFPHLKHYALLRDLGITRSVMTPEDVLRFLKVVPDLNDRKLMIRSQACSPGIAASMAWLSRSDVVMLAPFLLSRPIFNGKTILQILSEDVPDVSVDNLFPSHFEYSRLLALEGLNYLHVPIRYRPRRTRKKFYPLRYVPLHRTTWKTTLGHIWFDEPPVGGAAARKRDFSQMKREIPWLREDIQECLESSPFSEFERLLAFFNAYSKSAKAAKFCTLGGSHGHNFLEDIPRLNSIPGYALVSDNVATAEFHSEIKWLQLEDRFYNWCSLLQDLDYMPDACVSDILKTLDETPIEVIQEAMKQSDKVRRKFAVAIHQLVTDGTIESYLMHSDPGTVFYIEPQERKGDRYVGPGVIAVTMENGPCVLRVMDSEVTKITYRGRLNTLDTYLSSLALTMADNCRHSKARPDLGDELSLTYQGGFRLVSVTGYSQRFWGFKTYQSSGMRVDGVHGALLTDYMNNVVNSQAPNLRSLLQDDELTPVIIERIRDVRRGRFLYRLREREHAETMGPVIEDDDKNSDESDDDIGGLVDSILGEIEQVDVSDLGFSFEEIDEVGFRFMRREAEAELNIGQPCVLRWAAMANTLIISPDYKFFLLEDEELPQQEQRQLSRAGKLFRKIKRRFSRRK